MIFASGMVYGDKVAIGVVVLNPQQLQQAALYLFVYIRNQIDLLCKYYVSFEDGQIISNPFFLFIFRSLGPLTKYLKFLNYCE